MCVKLLSSVWLFAIPGRTVAYQVPPSMEFSRQEYWSGLPFPSPGESSWPRNRTQVSCIPGRRFTIWATRELYCVCFRYTAKWFNYTYICACMHAKSLQSCLTLCNPMDCSPPGSSVHGILQARTLEWVAIPSFRGSSRPRDQTCILCGSCIAGRFFTAEPPENPIVPWAIQ